MLDRIVLLQLNDDHATDAGRQEVAKHSEEVLKALPGVVDVRVGVAADDATLEEWDVSLLVRLDSADAIESYRVHPDHRSYVDEFLRPRLKSIRALNFADSAR